MTIVEFQWNYEKLSTLCKKQYVFEIFEKHDENDLCSCFILQKKTHWLDENCFLCVYCSKVKCRKNKNKMWRNDDNDYLLHFFIKFVDIFEFNL